MDAYLKYEKNSVVGIGNNTVIHVTMYIQKIYTITLFHMTVTTNLSQ